MFDELDEILRNIDIDAPLIDMKMLREVLDFEITDKYVADVNDILDIRIGDALAELLNEKDRAILLRMLHAHDAEAIRGLITEEIPRWDDVILDEVNILRGELIENDGDLEKIKTGASGGES